MRRASAICAAGLALALLLGATGAQVAGGASGPTFEIADPFGGEEEVFADDFDPTTPSASDRPAGDSGGSDSGDSVPVLQPNLSVGPPFADETDANASDASDGEGADGASSDDGPATLDIDGDGVPDDRERERGLDPSDPDTDGDGLPDGRELELGTDPTEADTDGDGLLDGWEAAGETPDGADLSGADPLRKDVFVQVDYARGTERKDQSFYTWIRSQFRQMPIDNPNGEIGIAVHVREGGRIDEPVRFTGDNFHDLKDAYYADRLGPRAGTYHHVVVAEFATGDVGYGEVGGRFVVAADAPRNETQRHVVVHELLHNLVGTIEAPGACEGDPHHYCDGGWLTPAITPGEEEYLPKPLATQLERQGFAAR